MFFPFQFSDVTVFSNVWQDDLDYLSLQIKDFDPYESFSATTVLENIHLSTMMDIFDSNVTLFAI